MKKRSRQLLLIGVLLILGAALVAGLYLVHPAPARRSGVHQKKGVSKKIIAKDDLYQAGNVEIDLQNNRIQFTGTVFKDKGWVQHLVYLEGYKWLKDESAIIALVRLVDLQRAIAILDGRLWDELWYRKTESREQRTENRSQKSEDKKLLLFLKWDKKEIACQELVLTEDKLEIGDFLFLGSPYFDYIALGAQPTADCRLCPLFALEEKALRGLFVRAKGESGYELNSERMPSCGTEVTIIIRLPK